MEVFALFSDGSTEKIIISSIGSKNDEKGLLLRSTIRDKALKESAERAVLNTYNYLLMKFPGNKSLLNSISVCILGFSGNVVGNSADLAFSLAFIGHLLKEGILKSNISLDHCIAATGTINDRLEVGSINNLQSKLQQIGNKDIDAVVFPRENVLDINTLQTDTILCPVSTLDEALEKLGITTRCSSTEANDSKNKAGRKQQLRQNFKARYAVFATILVAAIVLFIIEFDNISRLINPDLHNVINEDNRLAENSGSGMTENYMNPAQSKSPDIEVTLSSSPIPSETPDVNGDSDAGSPPLPTVSAITNEDVMNDNTLSPSQSQVQSSPQPSFPPQSPVQSSPSPSSPPPSQAQPQNQAKYMPSETIPFLAKAIGNETDLEFTSDDTSWKCVANSEEGQILDIDFGNGVFVAVGDHLIITSIDGVNWNEVKIRNYFATFQKVIWVEDRFYIPCYEGTMLTSQDGYNWRTISTPTNWNIIDITCGDGKYVAVGGNGTVMHSSDGEIWTMGPQLSESYLADVVWGNGKFLTIDYFGKVFETLDGISWNEISSINGLNVERIKFYGGNFIAVGALGGIKSCDGINWEPINDLSFGESINDLIKIDGGYLAVGSSGVLLSSEDLESWSRTKVGYANFFNGAAYGNGVTLAAGTLLNPASVLVWVGTVK